MFSLIENIILVSHKKCLNLQIKIYSPFPIQKVNILLGVQLFEIIIHGQGK